MACPTPCPTSAAAVRPSDTLAHDENNFVGTMWRFHGADLILDTIRISLASISVTESQLPVPRKD